MSYEIKYIELKTGYADNGPAWIGKVKTSKTGTTVYFNDHAFLRRNCGNGNYFDVETDEVYWISGVKKNGQDRHWAGNGKIIIDRKIISQYLQLVGQEQLDASRFIIEDIDDVFSVERIAALQNGR